MEKKFTVECTTDGWVDLPVEILNEMNVLFKKEEQLENPYNSLKKTIDSMTQQKFEYKLPDFSEFQLALDGIEIFKKTRIQDTYNVSQTTLGHGGYASVRMVNRISDDKEFAMKMVEYQKMKFN